MKVKNLTGAVLFCLLISFSQGLWGAEPVWQIKPLNYSFDALQPYIDAETMEIHYSRHHHGYYNNLVEAAKNNELANMPLIEIIKNISKWSEKVRNNAGGHFNHSFFWKIMTPNGKGKPSGNLAKLINSTFGSFDKFREEFKKAALTRFGSGWAWLCVKEDGSIFVTSTPNQDNPLMDIVDKKGFPILGLDVWEHAYYLNYQNKRGSYIDAFWKVVDWDEVERLYKSCGLKK